MSLLYLKFFILGLGESLGLIWCELKYQREHFSLSLGSFYPKDNFYASTRIRVFLPSLLNLFLFDQIFFSTKRSSLMCHKFSPIVLLFVSTESRNFFSSSLFFFQSYFPLFILTPNLLLTVPGKKMAKTHC